MKVGILTLPLHCNYGGILQAYALQEFLRREGHDTLLLDRQRNLADESTGARIYRMLCQQGMHRNMQRYIHHHLHCTPPLRSEEALRRAAEKLDALIVGSDQVWRPSMINGVESNYFLDFAAPGCRRIAYAASFGTDRWQGDDRLTARARGLLASFNAISVREREGITICRETFGQEAVRVADPTMLFDKSLYTRLLPATPHAPVGSLFHYLLGDKKECRPLVMALSERLGLTPYTVNAEMEVHLGKFTFARFPGPDRWIEGIHRSAFVLTDSFHGTVFALLFNKPFAVLANRSGGLSRITSLLERYGLTSRLMEKETLLATPPHTLLTLPYAEINPLMAEERSRSAAFLRNALSGAPADRKSAD